MSSKLPQIKVFHLVIEIMFNLLLVSSLEVNGLSQKYSRLRCLLRVKDLVICFYLGWAGSILQFRQYIIKVGSMSWLLTCGSSITLSLPSYTGAALKRELNLCNCYLSLLYFWPQLRGVRGVFFWVLRNLQEICELRQPHGQNFLRRRCQGRTKVLKTHSAVQTRTRTILQYILSHIL